MSEMVVDSRADIHPDAKIADNVQIGPWSVIGPNVEIGEGTIIGPHVVIKGPTKIGKNNRIHQFASIGEDPQSYSYNNEETWLVIGDNNVFREFCTVHRGTNEGGGVTRVGNHNWILAYVHIAHDCKLGNHILFINKATLSGHVTVEDYVTVGVSCAVHQYTTLGAYSFIAHSALVNMDVLPYTMVVARELAASHGINVVGLKRRGFAKETIQQLRKAYSIIYRQSLTVVEALPLLEEMAKATPEIQLMVDGIKKSERGILR